MKNTLFGLIAVLAVAVCVSSVNSDGQEDKVKSLMKRKLVHSQKILEGVAVNDFEEIIKNSEELILISKSSDWRVLKTPEYELFSNDFRRNAADLVKHSKEKNIDAAALSYVDMTLTCVRCHKHVREVRMTKLDPSQQEELVLRAFEK